MEITTTGYLREAPDPYRCKELLLYIGDAMEVDRLNTIMWSRSGRREDWVPPLRRMGYEWYLNLSVRNLITLLDPHATRVSYTEWLGRRITVQFAIKPYRFTDADGVIRMGGRADLRHLTVPLTREELER
jgi:hypothetical protein